MECPRCGAALVTYSVGDRDATACDRCGYAGVPADHRPDPAPEESWTEALARFRGRGADEDGERATPGDDGAALEIDGRTYRASPDLADRWANLTEKQRNVVAELLDADDPADPDRTRADIAEAAGVHPSYAGEVTRRFGDLAAAIREERDGNRDDAGGVEPDDAGAA